MYTYNICKCAYVYTCTIVIFVYDLHYILDHIIYDIIIIDDNDDDDD